MPQLTGTNCCAFAQIHGAGNTTRPEEIKRILDELKDDQKYRWSPDGPAGGQTAAWCITTPTEVYLEAILSDQGFKHVFSFPRRNGYPEGMLKLWVIDITQ